MSTIISKRIEAHQLEGLDNRKRVFNRHVDLRRSEKRYVSTFHYEGQSFSSKPQPTIKEALADLIQRLHQSGFSQLRSRINFRGKRYLAEREPWTSYNDPA